MRALLVVFFALLLSPQVQAKVLKVTDASASSFYPEENGVKYEPKHLKDKKQSTVWVEGKSGSGLGEWIKLELDGTQTVSKLRIWNGNWYSSDFWERHNRMKEIEVELSDGSKHNFTLKDEMKPETISFPKAISTSFVKIRYKSVYGGSTFNDTCISEVQVLDSAHSGRVLVNGYAASSIYPADADGDYDPENLGDHMIDSMWCEGNKSGDGAGEWVSFDFGSSKQITAMKIRNGNAYSFALSMKGNKAKDVTLTFSDGSTKKLALKGTSTEQTVPIGKNTSSIKMSFDTITKGSEFNDLCVSEAYFVE